MRVCASACMLYVGAPTACATIPRRGECVEGQKVHPLQTVRGSAGIARGGRERLRGNELEGGGEDGMRRSGCKGEEGYVAGYCVHAGEDGYEVLCTVVEAIHMVDSLNGLLSPTLVDGCMLARSHRAHMTGTVT